MHGIRVRSNLIHFPKWSVPHLFEMSPFSVLISLIYTWIIHNLHSFLFFSLNFLLMIWLFLLHQHKNVLTILVSCCILISGKICFSWIVYLNFFSLLFVQRWDFELFVEFWKLLIAGYLSNFYSFLLVTWMYIWPKKMQVIFSLLGLQEKNVFLIKRNSLIGIYHFPFHSSWNVAERSGAIAAILCSWCDRRG